MLLSKKESFVFFVESLPTTSTDLSVGGDDDNDDDYNENYDYILYTVLILCQFD